MAEVVQRLRRVELAMKRSMKTSPDCKALETDWKSFLGGQRRRETLEIDSSDVCRNRVVVVVATGVRYKNVQYIELVLVFI